MSRKRKYERCHRAHTSNTTCNGCHRVVTAAVKATARKKRETKFKCVKCGKLTTGRVPRQGKLVGDGSFRYPRRHNGPDGEPCPGNNREAEWVES